MKTYKDKNGNTIKAGDLCYYSERPNIIDLDSLVEIIELDGLLHSKEIVGFDVRKNRYEYENHSEPIDLKFSLSDKELALDCGGICNAFTILPSIEMADYNLVEYMSVNYPINKED